MFISEISILTTVSDNSVRYQAIQILIDLSEKKIIAADILPRGGWQGTGHWPAARIPAPFLLRSQILQQRSNYIFLHGPYLNLNSVRVELVEGCV